MTDSWTPPPMGPTSTEEIYHWVEGGRLAPDDALRYLKALQDGPTRPTKPNPPRPRPPEPQAETPEDVLHDLDQLIGLTDIKRMVREIRAWVEIQALRENAGLATDPHMLHMVFSGAPGTGKTTVARILGRLFHALGVLAKGHLVEVERADLVGEYIGHTAQKTRDVIKRALGGVMFLDEAYALARGGEKDFGKEAIDTLVAAMENHRGEFLLILAGYPDEMGWLMASNPGLMSRFPIRLEFPNYGGHDLWLIAHQMVRQRDYLLSPEADANLLRILTDNEGYWHKNAGNARMVRNLLEYAIRRQAVRLLARHTPLTRHDLMLLTWQDFEGGF